MSPWRGKSCQPWGSLPMAGDGGRLSPVLSQGSLPCSDPVPVSLPPSRQPKKAVLEVKFWQLDDWPMQQELPPCPATIISLLGEVERCQRKNQDSHVLVTCW